MSDLGESLPRRTSALVARNPRCQPLFAMYTDAADSGASTWSQVETRFLQAMGAFDTRLASTVDSELFDDERTELAADVQNGKGDFFNDLLALLLENSAGISHLYARLGVPGLIVPEHNLDGVFPATGAIDFLLEAKMMGTPRTALNPKQKPEGRRGSADLGKRVKELAFKSIDLKGEYGRRRAMEGRQLEGGGPGGADLTTWLRQTKPHISFFMAVRVLSDSDFKATLRWADTANQVVDRVGLFCYEPVDGSYTSYRARRDVPTHLQLDRALHHASLDLIQARDKIELDR